MKVGHIHSYIYMVQDDLELLYQMIVWRGTQTKWSGWWFESRP